MYEVCVSSNRWTGTKGEKEKQAKQQDKTKECMVNLFMLLLIEE